jgi:hypothetical protein
MDTIRRKGQGQDGAGQITDRGGSRRNNFPRVTRSDRLSLRSIRDLRRLRRASAATTATDSASVAFRSLSC